MKRFVMFLLVFVCCLSFISGSQRIVGANWDVNFDCPGTANDFHINFDLMSANNLIPKLHDNWAFEANSIWYMNGLNIAQDITNPEMWHSFVDFKTNGSISTGDTVHFGIEFLVENYNYLVPRMAYWTNDGEFVCPAQLLGFHVWEIILKGGSAGTAVTLFNESEEPMFIEKLEFAVTPFHVALEDMFFTGLGAPGEPGKFPEIKWVKVNDPILIQPKENVVINLKDLGVVINVDEFLQFKTFVNGNAQWFQHQQ